MRNILKRFADTPVGAEISIEAEDQVLFEEAGTFDPGQLGERPHEAFDAPSHSQLHDYTPDGHVHVEYMGVYPAPGPMFSTCPTTPALVLAYWIKYDCWGGDARYFAART